ncbi:MAG: hypothetical protein AMXMBFR47_36050 [Planctomycetota bacterium]
MRTIQAGIDSAVDGDVVLIADGVYTDIRDRGIQYFGKRITVRGASGPANCIIDALGLGRGFQFDNGETSESILEGVTIRNGYVHDSPGPGGAILCSGASPTIRSCVFQANRGSVNGGAIHVLTGNPLITGCAFTNNTADSNGGAISIGNGNATILDCTFEDNRAGIDGGAVRLNLGTSEVRNCVFRRNQAGAAEPDIGGGISLRNGTAIVRDCEFYENSAAWGCAIGARGGTIDVTDCTLEQHALQSSATTLFAIEGPHTIARCTLRNNGGEPVYAGGTIEDCILENNSTDSNLLVTPYGAVVRRCIVRGNRCDSAVWGQMTIEDSSVTDNTGGAIGGSILARRCEFRRNGGAGGLLSGLFENCIFESNPGAVQTASATTFRNCILRGFRNEIAVTGYDSVLTFEHCTLIDDVQITPDSLLRAYTGRIRLVGTILTRTQPSDARLVLVDNGAVLEVQYSAIEGGEERIERYGGLIWGPGNITQSPGLRRGDPHLRADSPCINAGPIEAGSQPDLDGEPRVASGRSDIGADEFTDIDADGMPDWWERQYFDSPTAGDAAGDPDGDFVPSAAEYNRSSNPIVEPRTIWVSTAGDDSYDGNARSYDGISGPKATILGAVEAAQPFEGDTIVLLPGNYVGARNRDILLSQRSITIRSDDPSNPDVVSATIVDPQGTTADPHRALTLGPGISADCAIQGITFRGGIGRTEAYNVYAGAAIHITRADARIEKCVFRQTGNARGAISTYQANPSIRDCLFTLCAGAGFYPQDSGATIENSIFDACESYGAEVIGDAEMRFGDCTFRNGGDGGLATQSLTGNLTVDDCQFENNGGTFGRSALQLRQLWEDESLQISVRRSNFINNQAISSGAAIDLVGRTVTVEIEDCVFENNRQSREGGAVFLTGGPVAVRRCVFRGNQSRYSGGGALYVGGPVLVEDCQFLDNQASTGGAVDGNELAAEFRRCRFEGNRATLSVSSGGRGGAVNGKGTYSDCIFVGNTAAVSGGAATSLRISSSPQPAMYFRRCTFANNLAPEGSVFEVWGRVILDQCAAAANINTRPGASASIVVRIAGDELSVDYSLIEGGQSAVFVAPGGIFTWGSNNREGDPRFVDPINGDVRIDAASALIDAGRPGVPETDIDGRGCTRLNDGNGDGDSRVDIGAVEYSGFVVDDDGPADYSTIQAAVDAAVDPCGRVILVRDGSYNERIRFPGSGIALVSEHGPDSTTVISPTGGSVLALDSVPDAFIRGFTFTGGAAERGGGASILDSTVSLLECRFNGNSATRGGNLFAAGSSVRLDRCTVEHGASAVGGGLCLENTQASLNACRLFENRATLDGGGAASTSDSLLVLSNCLFYANNAQRGGGIFSAGGVIDAVNCTLSANVAGAVVSGGLMAENSATELANSILWNNGGAGQFSQVYHTGGTVAVSYSCIQGGWSGSSNISTNPLFRNPANFEFDLLPSSPCADEGASSFYGLTPREDIAGMPRFQRDPTALRRSPTPRIDIGAFERPCGVDLDGDRDVDIQDLSIMLIHFGEMGASIEAGDVNADHEVDIRDLAYLLSVFGDFCW